MEGVEGGLGEVGKCTGSLTCSTSVFSQSLYKPTYTGVTDQACIIVTSSTSKFTW